MPASASAASVAFVIICFDIVVIPSVGVLRMTRFRWPPHPALPASADRGRLRQEGSLVEIPRPRRVGL